MCIGNAFGGNTNNKSDKTAAWSSGITGLATGLSMNAVSNQGDYAASVYNANASMLEQQATSVGQQGAWQSNKIRQQGQQVIGSQTAAMSANNLDVQAGSPLAILAGTARSAETDAQTATYNANLKMWGLQNQAKAMRAQSQYIQDAANDQKWGTLLTGITKVASLYSKMGG